MPNHPTADPVPAQGERRIYDVLRETLADAMTMLELDPDWDSPGTDLFTLSYVIEAALALPPEAPDALAQARARIAELEAGLRPLAELGERYRHWPEVSDTFLVSVHLGPCRRARELLTSARTAAGGMGQDEGGARP